MKERLVALDLSDVTPSVLAAGAKRREAEFDNVASLLRLREATISHLESLIRVREAEIEEATALARHREEIIHTLEQRLGNIDHVAQASFAALPMFDKVTYCLQTIDGWCSPAKALWLARSIVDRRASNVLEIGVFGGKSLIPMALAVQSLGGKVVGVEPWRADVAVAEATNEQNDAWWRTVDFPSVKSRFFANAMRYGVLPTIRILETDSVGALALFEHGDELFDLVHVDGAHSPQRALHDAISWSRFVRPGGLIVFDDIEWPSVRLAREFLQEKFRIVEEIVEQGSSYGAYEKP